VQKVLIRFRAASNSTILSWDEFGIGREDSRVIRFINMVSCFSSRFVALCVCFVTFASGSAQGVDKSRLNADPVRVSSGNGAVENSQQTAQRDGNDSNAVQSKAAGGSDAVRLVAGSRNAIIGTGFSPSYFDTHFTVDKIVNERADRRVTWRFSVNGYNAFITDAIGFYTDPSGKTVDVHSAVSIIGTSRDITRTLPRSEAVRLMKVCIGPNTGESVTYRPFETNSEAALIFTATTPVKEQREERERENKRERRERSRKSRTVRVDHIESEAEEGEGGKPVFIGALNLETGKCIKGRAIVGHP
jgi:hypothetical protein